MSTKKKSTRKRVAKKPTTKRQAAKKAPAKKRAKATPAVGATIERVFKGTTYKVVVTADGFAIGKDTYRSLTAAAKAITKYPAVSGPRFFGTVKAAKANGTENGGAK
jgi:hypothetical protein